ncbi:MAG: hypothetical protein Q4B63_04810 [Clostridium perfringens]|nr:hypothetical protein [Clostridium perfringens]
MTIYDLNDVQLSILATIMAYSVSSNLTRGELLTLIAFVSTLNSNLSLILAKDVRFNSTATTNAGATSGNATSNPRA